jgi:exodeoxyribonuclease V beta subunit
MSNKIMTFPRMDTLDLCTIPLSGTTLIEAGAGTGKTYTIAGLFLRLVLEQDLVVDEILVVTFTEAATEELRGRIRSRLREMLDLFRNPSAKSPDELEAHLLATIDADVADKRLENGLRSFDEASISTIHGFCRKVLQENAFESGVRFDTELTMDRDELIREVVADFWRTRLVSASPVLLEFMTGLKGDDRVTPDSLASLAGRCINNGFPRVEACADASGAGQEEADFMKAFEAVRDAWSGCREEVAEILLTSSALNRTAYKAANMPALIGEMDRLCRSRSCNPGLFAGFEKFSAGYMATKIKKKQVVPEHEFFGLCQELGEAAESFREALSVQVNTIRAEFLSYLQTELPVRKARRNVQTFDDLLTRVRHGLHQGPALARKIRSSFRAALIDEFQDTDPVQYDIFSTVFDVPDRILFLIGDPKQAIYGFRGADIFAYMQAVHRADSRVTMDTNYRSQPGLLSAVNHLFGRIDRPFLFPEIGYHPVSSPEGRVHELLQVDGEPVSSLTIWQLSEGDMGKAASRTKVEPLVTKAAAARIRDLLELGNTGRATIGARPVRPGDMAVLVRSNRQATEVKAQLERSGVPAVIYDTGNVFETAEAEELGRVLAAVAEPGRESLIRAALCTTLFGRNGTDLMDLESDEEGWNQVLEQFADFHDLWLRSGVISLLADLFARCRVRTRVLGLPGGERILTNLVQLCELLHAREADLGPGMTGLVHWFGLQRAGADKENEAHQLRLDRDSEAVTVVTVHKSKGLEYPVVFCPHLFADVDPKGEVLVHDPELGHEQVLDLGSDRLDERVPLRNNEHLAEGLRLVYVALTRARTACFTAWGWTSAKGPALGYLVHRNRFGEEGPGYGKLVDILAGLGVAGVQKDLTELVDGCPDIALESLPAAGEGCWEDSVHDESPLSCRTRTRQLPWGHGMTSFSGLARTAESARPGFDEQDSPVAAGEPEAGTLFAFPKGRGPGTMLHALLEHTDFFLDDPERDRALVQSTLHKHGFAEEWGDCLTAMLGRLRRTDTGFGFCFGEIRPDAKLCEMQFTLPLQRITPEDLAGVYREFELDLPEFWPDQMDRLKFSPKEGFLTGFMDMVCRHGGRYYLVDWKSNYLGPNVSWYRGENLTRAMTEHWYLLQYHLYCLGLDRYLSGRMPAYKYEEHFGGVLYPFLRGLDPEGEAGSGVYRDRPTEEFVRALEERLLKDPEG